MRSRSFLLVLTLVVPFACSPGRNGKEITVTTLLSEMSDLARLATLPEIPYRSVQYSSYDRRSKSAYQAGWFENDDGFGGEQLPGFEEVIKAPDSSGTGVYLMCDIRQPGVLVRLWTAGISGRIKVFLDRLDTPFFEGKAEDFFWKAPDLLTGCAGITEKFRQFDAVYFPIPFSKRCRIEWTGTISEIHFYHLGFRLYDRGTRVVTFRKENTGDRYTLDSISVNYQGDTLEMPMTEETIPPGATRTIWQSEGNGAIDLFSVRAIGKDLEPVLRKSLMRIYFDGAPTPHVEAPLGDFFGAAPGVNPYTSLPFTVEKDGRMICHFRMPFRENARIEITNFSETPVLLQVGVRKDDNLWEEGSTMHFRARWRISHGVIASDTQIADLTYLLASGQGRIAGCAAYIYNPSQVPTSWGNWWGEGDEKIVVDRDTFPSFFGTGSEDYFNYSWSSARIFSYAYCGQPRNDGPGNRGYVSDYRWHILDDILFTEKVDFRMELRHHGVVPGVSYGTIVYFYALPATLDDYRPVSPDDLRDLPYDGWEPLAYLGSGGYRFEQAENIVVKGQPAKTEEGRSWAGGKILMWRPVKQGDQIRFSMNREDAGKASLGFTLAKMPGGGSVSVRVNGKAVRCGGREIIRLFEQDQTVLDNFFTETVSLNKGRNEIVLAAEDEEPGKAVGIDFLWIKSVPEK